MAIGEQTPSSLPSVATVCIAFETITHLFACWSGSRAYGHVVLLGDAYRIPGHGRWCGQIAGSRSSAPPDERSRRGVAAWLRRAVSAPAVGARRRVARRRHASRDRRGRPLRSGPGRSGGAVPLGTGCRAADGRGAWPAVSVETLRPAETKHAVCVRSFRRMRSFHVLAARGAAVPRLVGAKEPSRGMAPSICLMTRESRGMWALPTSAWSTRSWR
jgi:hypothetical protein